MPDDTTNIRISVETWKRLNDLKDEPGKTWDDVMNELLDKSEGNANRMTPATDD
jgi:predicted DNA-binding protein